MSQARVPIFPNHLGLALLGTPFEVCTPLGHAGIMSSKISRQVYQQLFKKMLNLVYELGTFLQNYENFGKCD